jgi:hypothetical protein
MKNGLGHLTLAIRVRVATVVVLAALIAPGVAHAQRGKQERERVRPEASTRFKPPPGMCRIWIEGVPGSRQAAPTDCATALRNRPVNGRVVFGDDRPKQRAQPAKKGGHKSGRD